MKRYVDRIKDLRAKVFLKHFEETKERYGSLYYRDIEKNNLLHLAVIFDKLDSVKELVEIMVLKEQKNKLGLTPHELALWLNREECLKFFEGKRDSEIKVEKKGCLFRYSPEEFSKEMEVKFIYRLAFEDIYALRWVIRRSLKALKDGYIDRNQRWLGVFYEKEILSGYFPDLTIKWINPVLEYGLFTNQDLKTNDYIGAYVGVLRRGRRGLDNKNAYCFEYLIGGELKTPFTVDAREKGSYTRFINHSYTPNLTPTFVFSGGIMQIILRANCFIEKGTELTYDYGRYYWEKREEPLRR